MPLFHSGSSNRCLSSTSAEFVDIIHTDGDVLGNIESMGHVDFYPNGGSALQPGCIQQQIENSNLLGIFSEYEFVC